jgi:hypothetical protein
MAEFTTSVKNFLASLLTLQQAFERSDANITQVRVPSGLQVR